MEQYITAIFLFISGLVTGSFLTSYTYRLPKGESVAKGRSKCDNCGTKIAWFDNIPVISYIFLRGRARCCATHISLRYPLTEISLGCLFVFIYFYISKECPTLQVQNTVCLYKNLLGNLSLPYFLFVIASVAAIFIIDLENQFIPDEIIYVLFLITFLALVFSSTDKIYFFLLSAFLPALLLLTLHLITFGRGMGLGDVKLALALGLILGWPMVIPWFVFSFILGGTIGVVLLLLKKVRLGKHIPFGPFLIASFIIIVLYGDKLIFYLMPF